MSPMMSKGFVAQIGLRPDFPLRQTDLSYGLCDGYAKRCEDVEDRGPDLDLRNLPVEVSCREALAEQFHTMHFRLNAASTVVLG
jgi:hypothetical protein